ncbi:MAG: hypothetical protein EOO77_10160 [Oxalobacteraceae bacterium]|nr:MAG: hypothetical protein EOO77_10160 [Oxalobacteraceae bacterium]
MIEARRPVGAALVAGGMIMAAVPAVAQLLPPDESIRFFRYTPVRERMTTGYEVPGLPIGNFTLSPAVEVTGNATDNIFALEDDEQGDVFVGVTPSVQLAASSSNRSVNLSVDGTLTRYARNPTENLNAVSVSGYGTQDLGGQMRVRLLGRFRTNRESRESQNAFALTRRPIAFSEATGGVALSKRLGSILIAGEAGLQRYNYRDGQLRSGGELDQDYRDGTIRSVRGRADVIQSAAVAYFLQGSYTSSSYAQLSSLGVQRGAKTTEFLAGARFELPILARGEIGLGYITSAYRDGDFRQFSALAVNSRVLFFPSQLTTVTVNAVRSVNDAGTPDSSTYVALIGGIQVDHELLRSLIVSASFQYERDRFNGVDRRDGRSNLTASADYRLNRNYSLRVSADRLDLSSTGQARYKSLTRDRILVGLGVRI